MDSVEREEAYLAGIEAARKALEDYRDRVAAHGAKTAGLIALDFAVTEVALLRAAKQDDFRERRSLGSQLRAFAAEELAARRNGRGHS